MNVDPQPWEKKQIFSQNKVYRVCGLGEGEVGGEDNGGEAVRAAGGGP